MFAATPEKRRWSRSQQFTLSAKGIDAEAGYRSDIALARTEGGRASFDAARTRWAGALGLQPEDGVCLVELRAGALSLGKLVEALDDYGQTRTGVVDALGRLSDAGLVDPVLKA
jgi:hypothetical protein